MKGERAIHSPSVVAVHEKQGEKRNGEKQQVSMGESRDASVGRNTREMSSREMEIHLEFKVDSHNFSRDHSRFEIGRVTGKPENLARHGYSIPLFCTRG